MAKRKPCKPKPKMEWLQLALNAEFARIRRDMERKYFVTTLANPAQVLTSVIIK